MLNTTDNRLNTKIIHLCNKFDEEYNLEVGTALTYVKYLIARKIIVIYMVEKLDVRTLKIDEINIKGNGGNKIDYFFSSQLYYL